MLIIRPDNWLNPEKGQLEADEGVKSAVGAAVTTHVFTLWTNQLLLTEQRSSKCNKNTVAFILSPKKCDTPVTSCGKSGTYLFNMLLKL